MRFALFFIALATVSAVQLQKDTPAADAHKARMLKEADAQHKVTMARADGLLKQQQSGVAASAQSIKDWKAATRAPTS